MKPFKITKAVQVVYFNNDNPDKQMVTKEDVITTTSYMWGLIVIEDIKDITQHFGDGESKKLGFK